MNNLDLVISAPLQSGAGFITTNPILKDKIEILSCGQKMTGETVVRRIGHVAHILDSKHYVYVSKIDGVSDSDYIIGNYENCTFFTADNISSATAPFDGDWHKVKALIGNKIETFEVRLTENITYSYRLNQNSKIFSIALSEMQKLGGEKFNEKVRGIILNLFNNN